jgi:TRAP-type C4-dicarboxylate transport system permease small subunit
MKVINSIYGFLARFAGSFSAVIIFGMMALVTTDVLIRYIFNTGILGTYEVVQLAMAALVFFALPYAQYKKELVRVSFILVRLPRILRYVLWALGDVISTAVCYALSVAAFIHAGVLSQSIVRTSVLLIPMYPFYYLASLALLLFAIVLTCDLIKAGAAIFIPKYAEEVASHWGA